MNQRTGRLLTFSLSLSLILSLLVATWALASGVDVAVVDVTVPTNSVTLQPGQSAPVAINMTVTGNQEGTATFEVYRDWTLSGGTYTGSNPQEFTVPPRGPQDPATTFSTTGMVKVAAGQAAGTYNLTVGVFDITNSNSTGAKLSTGRSGIYSVTVTAPANTPPGISVTGVSNGATYEIGAVPAASCQITDAEDGPSSKPATLSPVTGSLAIYGLGEQTASCSYTDRGGLTATASAAYTIDDTTNPTITFKSRTPANANGWNNSDVEGTWTCSDSGSGVVAGEVSQTITTEGENQSITGTCTDNAGNTASDTQSGINIDKTQPMITYSGGKPATAWSNGDVTITWSCSDSLSGAASSTVSETITGEGASLSATGTCGDLAGNTASDTQSGVNIDRTAPVLSFSEPAPAPNGNGWHNSPVTVSWTCTDAMSGATTTGGSQTLTQDGAGQSVSGACTDLAGNSVSGVKSGINIDMTAPNITFESRTPANINGWNNADVTITWTCSDDLAGAEAETVSQTVSGEGENLSTTGTCTDNAGNTASNNQSGINIDKTAPAITVQGRTPAANAFGWNNEDVTVTWTCSDDLSGVVLASDMKTVSTEGLDQSVQGTCTDKADNTVSDTQTGINIDKTLPTIVFQGRTPAANAFGWNNEDVTVTWTCSDALSDVVHVSDMKTVSTESANQSVQGTCTDKAGNSAAHTVTGINIDKTKPELKPTVDPNPVIVNASATVNANATDELSGIASWVCGLVDTSKPGSFTVSCSAEDKAGNFASAEASYTVSYKVCVLFDQTKSHKKGSTVPIKLQLCDINGANLSDTSVVLNAFGLIKVDSNASPTVEDSGNANPDSNFRYSPDLSGYIFNLSTKNLSSGTWRLDIKVTGFDYFLSVKFDVK